MLFNTLAPQSNAFSIKEATNHVHIYLKLNIQVCFLDLFIYL